MEIKAKYETIEKKLRLKSWEILNGQMEEGEPEKKT